MYKAVPKQIKEEILVKVRAGEKVTALAAQYGISDKTVYLWLAKLVTPEVTLVKYNRLKKENEELKRIIGLMALDLELEKKRKVPSSRRQ